MMRHGFGHHDDDDDNGNGEECRRKRHMRGTTSICLLVFRTWFIWYNCHVFLFVGSVGKLMDLSILSGVDINDSDVMASCYAHDSPFCQILHVHGFMVYVTTSACFAQHICGQYIHAPNKCNIHPLITQGVSVMHVLLFCMHSSPFFRHIATFLGHPASIDDTFNLPLAGCCFISSHWLHVFRV